MGGVGGTAVPLTLIVSAGFPGGAGYDFACKIISLHGGTAVRDACSPDSYGVHISQKWFIHFCDMKKAVPKA